ncbi:MAG: hypothetical protein CGW95_07815 [Phenylobacterium zucineum]|nr:MAG: hypothetical protein CGW95_07815 [Phenylobacterium zucineum]
MKKLLIFVALLALTACATTTNTRLAAHLETPKAGTKILVIKPAVRLALMTAAGLSEARADWSAQGEENLQIALETQLRGANHPIEVIDPDQSMGGREGQLLRLHQAVGATIATYNYSGMTLPTKAKTFDWTLGDGVKILGEAHGADYALFTSANGTYASAGRIVAMVGAAALGFGIPLGSQYVVTSLVDLHTGQVVWFNMSIAGPNDDMRKANGAQTLITTLMAKAPL